MSSTVSAVCNCAVYWCVLYVGLKQQIDPWTAEWSMELTASYNRLLHHTTFLFASCSSVLAVPLPLANMKIRNFHLTDLTESQPAGVFLFHGAGCGSVGRAGRQPIRRLVVRSPAPPVYMSKCPWSTYWTQKAPISVWMWMCVNGSVSPALRVWMCVWMNADLCSKALWVIAI